MKVFINPGHCVGTDPGAVGFGLKEAEIAKNIGAIVESGLVKAGIEVKSLQSDDLDDIPIIANNWGADIFVSIHCNAFNGVAMGTETLIYRSGTQGAKLAECIQNNIIKTLSTVDRGLKERPNLCVLRSTDMPAVLVETAFIDEESDNALLRDKQADFAHAIIVGILQYAGINALTTTINTRKTAPNGKEYEQNDIDYLLSQGYTLADALSFLDTTDKYKAQNENPEVKIWNFFKSKGLNDFAVAGIMGNLFAESGLLATNLQNNFENELGSDEEYTRKIDNGEYGKEDFMHDSAGYGLAQWTYYTRKGALLDYAKPKGVSIGDLDMQLDFLWGELSEYGGLIEELKNVASVREASDAFLLDFERPADQGDGQRSRRAGYSQEFYDKYAGTGIIAPNGKPYEQNDIDFLLNNGYTYEKAIKELSKAEKYRN